MTKPSPAPAHRAKNSADKGPVARNRPAIPPAIRNAPAVSVRLGPNRPPSQPAAGLQAKEAANIAESVVPMKTISNRPAAWTTQKTLAHRVSRFPVNSSPITRRSPESPATAHTKPRTAFDSGSRARPSPSVAVPGPALPRPTNHAGTNASNPKPPTTR